MDDFDELQFKEFELKRRVGLKSISSHVVHGGRHGPKKPLGGDKGKRGRRAGPVLKRTMDVIAAADFSVRDAYDEHRTRTQMRDRPLERYVALRLIPRVDVAEEGRHRIVVNARRVEGVVLS